MFFGYTGSQHVLLSWLQTHQWPYFTIYFHDFDTSACIFLQLQDFFLQNVFHYLEQTANLLELGTISFDDTTGTKWKEQNIKTNFLMDILFLPSDYGSFQHNFTIYCPQVLWSALALKAVYALNIFIKSTDITLNSISPDLRLLIYRLGAAQLTIDIDSSTNSSTSLANSESVLPDVDPHRRICMII